ncbi:phage minor structural protein, N-terminal region [Clostridium acidisoli DSM 12555]|uniref:Phage minor structural protein, N-terminal region n=1 Tax=Clostridium acidisoli DSM 12555 TaxID=1121291 RepID=A0A1W1XTH9_9CLOT|nr:phage tail spike protein [Clostridium acidisoli]SMC26828.1 phage minor structural protein, N-terminal region [Clostridium acidisoli DSM 12555]
MLILYDKDHNKIAGLTNYKEYNLEREINSEDTLSFQYPSNDLDNRLLEQECYIRTKENEYIIKEVNYEDDDWVSYVCKINIEDIKGQNVDHFEVDSENCTDAVNLALSGTGWTVGACDVSRIRPVSKSKCTAYDVLQEIQSSYDCEISYDSINKKAYIYNEMGNDRGAYFAEQLNLKSLEVQGNSYDYVTMLVPIGKDGLDITSVNNGKNYVENYQYSSKKLIGYWEDNRYTDPNALMEDAVIQLEYLSKPLKSYKVDLVDLAKAIDAENYDTYKLIDYSLGDAVTILSKEKNVKEKQRIVKMTIYPDEPERNEVELSNKSPSLEYLQIKFEDTADTVDSITTSDGMIDGSKVDSIDWDKIDHIHVKIADVENLSATIANIGTLTATKANITDLDTTNAAIQNLQSDKVNVEDLTASNARINTLEVGAEGVNTLLAGNLSASNMQAGFITANSGLIANGAIANAQIINLDLSKLNAGNISTNKFVVQSDSGNLQIKGNVLKVWDTSGKERVSLGLNDNDYNLLIRGTDGNTVLFGTDGVTKAGITVGAVDDSKIDINANINGQKLNIDSVFSTMNNCSSTLKTSKIKFDDTGQTLDVAFTGLKQTVDDNSKIVSNQSTSISILQGQITSKVTQTDINNSIDNIQVGGRNLLTNSILNNNVNSIVTGCRWLANQIAKDGSTSGYEVICGSTGALDGGIRISNTISQNGTYTFSCYVKSGDLNTYPFGIDMCDTSAGIINVDTNWTKYVATVTVSNYSSSVYNFIDFDMPTANSRFYVCLMKLESGNKATDWTVAPEDVQSKICGLTFDNLVGCVSNENNLTSNNSNAGWGNSGCSSVETFTNGNYLECTIASNYSSVMTGLSHSNTNENYTSINYAWYTDSANLQIYENGTQIKNLGTFTVGEILRISVENNQINYYRNGVLEYTSTQTPTLPLVLDTAFYNAGSGANNINKGTMLSGIVSRLSTAESSITQLSNQINLTVTTDTYNSGMESANSNAKSYANTAQSNAISGANSHTDSQINILQGQINSKVDVNGVQSTITQSPTQVQIAFNNINSAKVKIDSNGLHVTGGSITSPVISGGIISGISISGSTITGSTINANGTLNVENGVIMGNEGYTTASLQFGTTATSYGPLPSIYANNQDGIRLLYTADNHYFSCASGKGVDIDGNLFIQGNATFSDGSNVVHGNYGTYAIGIVQGSTNYLQICNNSGAWGASIWGSDISMKTNVQDSLEDALPVINNIKHRMFNWKQDGRLQKLGYVAQELNEINSDFVMKIPQENGYVRMQPNETTIIPYLSKAIQELSKEINDLKEEMEKLKGNSLIGQ